MRKAGNRVRVACQLIHTANGMHIWANRYDGILEDIFDLQDQVTANIVNAIAWQLQRAAVERGTSPQITTVFPMRAGAFSPAMGCILPGPCFVPVKSERGHLLDCSGHCNVP